MIFPMVAAFLLARSIEWYWVYACIGLVYLAIFILSFGCEFPALGKTCACQQNPRQSKEKMGHRRVVSLRRPRCVTSSVSWVLSPGCRNTPKVSV
ncbi:TsgA protein -like protein [Salmonella bongori]|nr:TsgA protein -like protein [Salmonella bongori]